MSQGQQSQFDFMKIFFRTLTVLTILVLPFAFGLLYLKGSKPLPDYGPAPSFSLVNQNNEPFNSSSLEGKVWIADFIFTRCGMACPKMNAAVIALIPRLGKTAFISFTVDPEYDTPQVLKSYTEKFGLEYEGWSFLTGKWADIQKVAQGFKVAAPDEPMFHSSKLILVDSQGLVRGYYDVEDTDSIKLLARHAKKIGG